MSYPVRFEDEAISTSRLFRTERPSSQRYASPATWRENPHLGERLRNRSRIGDLTICRAVRFDKEGRRGKPRYRLVYYNDPDDGSIAVVRVIAVGLRAQLEAYKVAAARLRRERRDQLGR